MRHFDRDPLLEDVDPRHADVQYLSLAREVLTSPYSVFEQKSGHTAVGAISLFGEAQASYDFDTGAPILTTKKVYTNASLHEAVWKMRGDDNIKYLVDNKVPIWNKNAFQHNYDALLKDDILERREEPESVEWDDQMREVYIPRIKESDEFSQKYGSLTGAYGKQLREWKTEDGETFDQLGNIVNAVKNGSTSRSLLYTFWNAPVVPHMGLPPCPVMTQIRLYKGKDGTATVNTKTYQRSADTFLGVPFNMTDQAFVQTYLGEQLDMEARPGRFIHTFGDFHDYTGKGDHAAWYGVDENRRELARRITEVDDRDNYMGVVEWLDEIMPPELDSNGEVIEKDTHKYDHVPALLEQMSRKPLPSPTIRVDKVPLDELRFDNIHIDNYESHGPIRRCMAV